MGTKKHIIRAAVIRMSSDGRKPTLAEIAEALADINKEASRTVAACNSAYDLALIQAPFEHHEQLWYLEQLGVDINDTKECETCGTKFKRAAKAESMALSAGLTPVSAYCAYIMCDDCNDDMMAANARAGELASYDYYSY